MLLVSKGDRVRIKSHTDPSGRQWGGQTAVIVEVRVEHVVVIVDGEDGLYTFHKRNVEIADRDD